ncbi:hypothetical protein D9611_002974 [Ephemerocybe angulata]|uniref:SH3 domain-containing protein n=1 Tax=Ephemerocybe angulata TaxID=980116 RepID=A0A8H5C8X5_9AGAR|nr:hypothetical protein D9611_002974 [Tulosesus angulatus]
MSRPAANRQDTFDLRDQILGDEHNQIHAHADAANHYGTDDEEHSVLEDDSEGDEQEDYLDEDDDASSSLSIPNESIDFDLVYAFHSFAATVDGQANVVKGDSLFLMDDSNSYWWLVRVLKTQEVGYIPAENIETPFERLARLNKHRNVDLASATQAELQDGLNASQDRLRNNLSSRAGTSPSPNAGKRRKAKGVQFTPTLSVHRYLPAVWREDEMSDEEDVEWDDEGYEDEDEELANEQMQRRREEEEHGQPNMEPDDPMQWADEAVEQRQQVAMSRIPDALQPGSMREQQQHAALRAQQQQQLEQQQREQEQRQLLEQQQTQQHPNQLQPAQARPGDLDANGTRRIDPLEETETRKLTVTPTIARELDDRPAGQPYLPSAIIGKQQSDDSVKRRMDEEADEAAKKKARGSKMGAPVSSSPGSASKATGKLRKAPSGESDDDSKDKKKKSGGFISNLFRPKEKKKKIDGSASINSTESSEYIGRTSEDSGVRPSMGSSVDGALSPVSVTALQQQQQVQPTPASPPNLSLPSTPDRNTTGTHVSPLANTVRQRDQQQQALYQQYLNRSPSSPPEISYGLQSASAVMPLSSSTSSALGPPSQSRPRPGSLILTASGMGMDGPGVPELSVVRVFAGKNLQTDATFKTVLLNASTSSGDLVRQAIQRFRLPAGEDANDYYLTIKQVEGGASAVLRHEEHPLVVFETLVTETMELPKVKRSSVGSISSVVSNLSMHPAISKLPMNDFTDDSAVKFYLNRRSEDGDDSSIGHEGDETLIADSSHGGDSVENVAGMSGGGRGNYLTVSVGNANVTPERFTSPSFRFPLQLVIYPDDLPDDMVFHPTTEAIVFKDSLRDSNASLLSPSVSTQLRRKVFIFPKNITVAEVIELGLERFGISDGVVDGGDEVEDKYSKRASHSRVRYGLVIDAGDGRERELSPSSKVIDAFTRPPTFRTPERQAPGSKRRSLDAVHLLGSAEDVHPEDPIFILRRAISYRSPTSRHRTSAPLDELALANLHRESRTSDPSSPTASEPMTLRQASSREIIAAQRAATRANQRAILSAQTNSVRGMDVLLPGNAVLRSSRYDANDRMRYSYVEPDGETYDISHIVEEEWRDSLLNNANAASAGASSQRGGGDLLEGVLARSKGGNLGDQLDRVLNKIKSGKEQQQQQGAMLGRVGSIQSTRRSVSESEYSDDGEERSRDGTPGSAALNSRFPSGNNGGAPASRQMQPQVNGASRRQPSVGSVTSAETFNARGATDGILSRIAESPRPQQKKPVVLPKDDFGISHMMAIIEYKALQPQKPSRPIDPADELLFGTPIDLESLHPLARDIYAAGFKQLEDMDKILDGYIRPSVGAF